MLKVGVPVNVLAEVPLWVYPPDAAMVVKAPVVGVEAPTVPLMFILAVPVRLVTTPEAGVPSAGVVNEGDVSSTTLPVPFHTKSDEVARTVGTAEALVWLAQSELAAMAAKLSVPVVVIVPPARPVPEPTEDTVAFEVLHVPDPVIAPVPFPVRQPVRVTAPVPPFATVKAFVRLSVFIKAVPVVVAPPEMVSPPACVPLPMVEEA